MTVITWKDYFFSLSRGSFFEASVIIFKYIIKSIIFKLFGLIYFFRPLKKVDISKSSNIAIYFPTNTGLGDLVLCDYFFKAVKELFPNAKIFVYSKNGQFINPKFYDAIIDNSKIGIKSQLDSITANKIDLFLLPEKSIKGSIIFLTCSARHKIGYFDSYRLKANFIFKTFEFIPHQTPYYLKSYSILKSMLPLNENESSFTPDLSFINTERPKISKEYVLFIPCVTWENRSISYENVKIVMNTLLKRGHTIYLSGGMESVEMNKQLIKIYQNEKEKIICNDLLKLDEFVNVVKHSKAIICGDSGPLYLSFGFHKPVLSFWGPTFPNLKINPMNKNENHFIYEKEKCKVVNCYNMENKPFCKNCLRLIEIPDLEKKVSLFLETL